MLKQHDSRAAIKNARSVCGAVTMVMQSSVCKMHIRLLRNANWISAFGPLQSGHRLLGFIQSGSRFPWRSVLHVVCQNFFQMHFGGSFLRNWSNYCEKDIRLADWLGSVIGMIWWVQVRRTNAHLTGAP